MPSVASDSIETRLETIERELLLEGIFRHYGYDFREYSLGSLKRRIRLALEAEGLPNLSALQERILRSEQCMERFVATLGIHATSMFRDPEFYRAVCERVMPQLRTYPFFRIWVAGCSSGEEAYSLAILLEEQGLYDRCRIYATDLSEAILRKAQAGIFSMADMREYTENYQRAGGQGEFSSFYTAKYESVIFRESLKRNLTFSCHNLATDASFSEFNVILCRNVMIYFSKPLQERVLALFHSSLCSFGFLGLGNKETLNLSPHSKAYGEVQEGQRLYRRVN